MENISSCERGEGETANNLTVAKAFRARKDLETKHAEFIAAIKRCTVVGGWVNYARSLQEREHKAGDKVN